MKNKELDDKDVEKVTGGYWTDIQQLVGQYCETRVYLPHSGYFNYPGGTVASAIENGMSSYVIYEDGRNFYISTIYKVNGVPVADWQPN